MQQLPSRIHDWLNKRGISDDVLALYQIGWSGSHIIIPVHDVDGKILFNKYRRDPDVSEGPKYRYEKGGSSVLYGLKGLEVLDGPIILCEGEMDCLLLLSKGYQAISSTGGASTFNPEWASLLSGFNVIICYDTDDAGLKGALNVQSMVGHAGIALLPSGVKDITDFFITKGKTKDDFERILNNRKIYLRPIDWKSAQTKKELQSFEKMYKTDLDMLLEEARHLREGYQSDALVQKVIENYNNKYAEVRRQIKYFQPKRKDLNGNRLAQAKAVPIPQFIKFTDNTACCIWHNERTPSMHYYEKQNRVKCFGCDKLGDVIDVVQKLRGVGLTDAIKIILDENK